MSQDLCEFEPRQHLITVDLYSDYIEVDQLYDKKSTTVIEKLKTQFARHGIPDLLLTDHGLQFISVEFAKFCGEWHINHQTSSPYWPKGNGKVDWVVKVIKNMMKKCDDLELALLSYRNMPNKNHSQSPAQRSMNRHLKWTLPVARKLLIPNESDQVQNEIVAKKQQAKSF